MTKRDNEHLKMMRELTDDRDKWKAVADIYRAELERLMDVVCETDREIIEKTLEGAR